MDFVTPLSEFVRHYKHEKNSRAKQRLHVLVLRRQRYTQQEIAQLLRITQGTVSNVCRRFKKEGWSSVYDKPREGRPARLNKDQENKLREIVSTEFTSGKVRRGWQTKDVRTVLKTEFRTEYTPQHIRRILHKLGMSWKAPRPEHKNRNPGEVEEFKKKSKGRFCLWQMNTSSSV